MDGDNKVEMPDDESPDKQPQDCFGQGEAQQPDLEQQKTALGGSQIGMGQPSQRLDNQLQYQYDYVNHNEVRPQVYQPEQQHSLMPPEDGLLWVREPVAAPVMEQDRVAVPAAETAAAPDAAQDPQGGIVMEPPAADQNAAAAPPAGDQQPHRLSERIRQAEQEVQAAEVQQAEQDGYILQRRQELQGRVQQVKEENARNAFGSLIIFIVFVCLTAEDSKDLSKLYAEVPQAAIFLVGSIILYGLEFFIQSFACIKFSVECNKPCCPLGWSYITFTIIWNSWGASIGMGEQFGNFYSKFEHGKEPRMKSLVLAIMWLRFIGSIFLSIVIYCMAMCFCKWKLSNDQNERLQNKKHIENVTVYIFKSKYKYQRRSYDAKLDSDITCSICLGQLSDTPDRELAQLDCNSLHVFHNSCLQGWLVKQSICPLCRKDIPMEV